jgi:CheY-like chemotaxis protein
LHDGSIHAQSSGLGNGATFTIVLPLASQEPVVSADSPLEAQRDLPLPAALSVDLTGISVVAVDDDAATREFLRRLLNHCKAFVTVVGNVDDALLAIEEIKPQVVLCDIEMPGQDGYALIRRVRALGPDRGGDALAIAVTAYVQSVDRARTSQAGFQLHIAKPIEPVELVSVIASLVKRRPFQTASTTK